jgi:hypothetical protein
MFHYVEVQIRKSETTVATISVPPWELPVLAAVHGGDRLIPTGRLIPVNRAKPDPQGEYDRLEIKYRSNRDKGGSAYVAEVYGAGEIGTRRLAEEMARRVRVAAPAPVAPTIEFEQVPEGEDVGSDDPLAGLFDDAPAHAEGAQPIAE